MSNWRGTTALVIPSAGFAGGRLPCSSTPFLGSFLALLFQMKEQFHRPKHLAMLRDPSHLPSGTSSTDCLAVAMEG